MIKYDVVVVGAGILGLSTAYHIKKEHPTADVLVVDRLSGPGQANTARSAAAFRCIFSSPTNHSLADSSVEFYRHLEGDLEVDLKMDWIGYLWLLAEEEYRKMILVLKGLASELDVRYEEYTQEYLAERLGLKTDFANDEEARLMKLKRVFGGILIPKAGVINDVDNLVKFYEAEFIKLKGRIRYGVEVGNLVIEPQEPLGIPKEHYFWQDIRVAGVNTNKGLIESKKIVLATGAWLSQLSDAVGIECYVKPRKRQFFALPAKNTALKQLLHTDGFNSLGCLPFTVLPSPEVYIRPFPKEEVYWVGYADEFPRSYKLEEDPQAEKRFYEYGIYQVLVKYFPQFKDCRPTSNFAGLYEVNTLDGNPIIFERKNLLVVGGASGSGITKADAIGRIAAAVYSGEDYAYLYGDRRFRVSDLGLKERHIEPEGLIL